jgi:hypothetical protein
MTPPDADAGPESWLARYYSQRPGATTIAADWPDSALDDVRFEVGDRCHVRRKDLAVGLLSVRRTAKDGRWFLRSDRLDRSTAI